MQSSSNRFIGALAKVLEAAEHSTTVDVSRQRVLDIVESSECRARDVIAEEFESYELDFSSLEFVDRWKVRYLPMSATFRCERIPTVAQIERYAELNNRIAEQELRERLSRLRGAAFERVIAQIMGGCEWIFAVSGTKVSGDGGIDLHFTLRHAPFDPIQGIAQIKGWEQKVGVTAVREFIGVIQVTEPKPKVCLFIAINGYTTSAIETASKYTDIRLLTLDDVLSWQRESQVGVSVSLIELFAFDDLLWSELDGEHA